MVADADTATAASDTLELTEENVEKVLDEVRRATSCVNKTPPSASAGTSPPARAPSALIEHVVCAGSCSASQVRPYLMADGGNVELAEIDGLVVKLKLNGACGSCPSRRAPRPSASPSHSLAVPCARRPGSDLTNRFNLVHGR